MNIQRSQIVFFFIFIFAVLILNFFIFLPYFSVLFLALVFSIIFTPIHNKILFLVRGRENQAAILSILLILVIIVGPLFFVGFLLFDEASELYISALNQGVFENGFSGQAQIVISKLESIFPNIPIAELQIDLAKYIKEGLAWILDHMSVLFSGFLKILFGLLLLLLSLFYFFRDGGKFVNSIISLSPLNDTSDRQIIQRMIIAVNSVVRGSLAISVVQGLLTGIGFALFGVPSPVLGGLLASVASLVPTIGTALIIIPGILFLVLSGSVSAGIGLLIWGVIAVGLIDNFLGPILIERGVKIHPFLILLSALGGLSFFGPVGFLAGPVVLSLLFALFDVYPSMLKRD